jgi:hypothetical protein
MNNHSAYNHNNQGDTFDDEPPAHDPYNNNQPNRHPQQDPYYETGGEPEYNEDDPYGDDDNNNGAHRDPNSYQQEGFDDHDPYAQEQQHHSVDTTPHSNQQQPPEQAQQQQPSQPEPREFKYSTARMNESGKCRKWCSILATFLFFLAFMIGLSILFNHFFFGDKSDNGPAQLQRPANVTFPKDKQEIDSACGRATLALDQGELCKEACAPQFFKCCDPFDELALYNATAGGNLTDVGGNSSGIGTNISSGSDQNATAQGTSKRPSDEIKPANLTFLQGHDDFNASACGFDIDVRGCMSYAKCQALVGQADPAPANLPDMCSLERLAKDDGGCKDLCSKLDCCYSLDSDNCMADKFDLCMDYAPCQNLRSLDKRITDTGYKILETAPRTLDYDCFWQQPGCNEACAAAKCCSAESGGAPSCLHFDFMACLTYSPCTGVTDVNITIPKQFSKVGKPPKDIVYACNKNKEAVLQPTPKNCESYCAEAQCCFDQDAAKNCFQEDPLGCLAWEAQCQVLGR